MRDDSYPSVREIDLCVVSILHSTQWGCRRPPLEVITGVGGWRSWSRDDKAQIVADSCRRVPMYRRWRDVTGCGRSRSMSLRGHFLRLENREKVPDHSWLSKTRGRLPHEVHERVFGWVMKLVAEQGLVKGICCIGGKGRAARRLRPAQAARPKICCTKARCAGMSPLGTARTCPLASIAIASMPASVRFAVQKP